MRRIITLAVAVTLLVHTASPLAIAAAQAQATGSVTGVAKNTTGETLGNFMVQIRNVETGQVAGVTASNAAGSFTFNGVQAGSYVVEVVNASGQIVGSSAVAGVGAGSTVALTVTATGAVLAGGAIGTLPLVLLLAAAGAGVSGVVLAAREEASPSR